MAKRPSKPRASAKSTAARKTTMAEPPTIAPAATDQESKYTVGDHISHPMFGDGFVTAIDAKKLTIEFTDKVMKQIVDDYVRPRKP